MRYSLSIFSLFPKKQLFSPHISLDIKQLSLDAHFNKDLGLDSLDVVEVILAVEEEFDTEIPDQAADNMRSPRDAVNWVYARLSGKPMSSEPLAKKPGAEL